MKRYYYITLLATLAVICLQTSYVYSLYKNYKEEKAIKLHKAFKKAIEDELTFNAWKNADMNKVKELTKKFEQEHNSTITMNNEESKTESALNWLQDIRLYTNDYICIDILANYFSTNIQANEHNYAIYLLDKNKNVVNFIDSL
ncbi:hypothetical protein B5F34_03850 [Mediterranea sp. An20]|nr:hypothetical protein [Mediterranea sp. An20]OUP11232.1 hypothetical protein B5F34_03850 [Mediterranea sp. An20]